MYQLKFEGRIFYEGDNPISINTSEDCYEAGIYRCYAPAPSEGKAVEILEVDPPVPVPASVSMRQAQLELFDAGLLDDVEALVATLPRPYQIEWAKAGTVMRDNPLVEIVRQQQGLTIEDIDNLFIRADKR